MAVLSEPQGDLTRSGVLDRGIPQDLFRITVEFHRDQDDTHHRNIHCASGSTQSTHALATDVWDSLCDTCWLEETPNASLPWENLIRDLQGLANAENYIHTLAVGNPYRKIWALSILQWEYQEDPSSSLGMPLRDEFQAWHALLQELISGLLREVLAEQSDREHLQDTIEMVTLAGHPTTYAQLQDSPRMMLPVEWSLLRNVPTLASSYLLRQEHLWRGEHLIVWAPRDILGILVGEHVPAGNFVLSDPALDEMTLALWDPAGEGHLAQLVHAQAAAQALA